MFSWFRKFAPPPPIPLREQLAELAKVGVTPASYVTEEDWASFEAIPEYADKPEVVEYEKAPYLSVIEALGSYIPREPYSPMCDKLWMCDYECIQDEGAYQCIIERLQLLSGHRLALSNVASWVDDKVASAGVEFDYQGTRLHWDAKLNNDWMDPRIIDKFHELLRRETDLTIYSNHTPDYGQTTLFACMTEAEFTPFNELSRVKFRPLKLRR